MHGIGKNIVETLGPEEINRAELAKGAVENQHLIFTRLQMQVVVIDVVGDVGEGDGIAVLGQYDGHAGGALAEARHPVDVHADVGLAGVVELHLVAIAGGHKSHSSYGNYSAYQSYHHPLNHLAPPFLPMI